MTVIIFDMDQEIVTPEEEEEDEFLVVPQKIELPQVDLELEIVPME